MRPQEIIKYVFAHEGIDYDLLNFEARHRPLIQVRQRSAYLIHYFFPHLHMEAVAEMIGKDRCTILHYYKTVTGYIATDKKYSSEMANYILNIRKLMNKGTKYKLYDGGVVEYRMTNKRLIIEKHEDHYLITAKKLDGRKITYDTIKFSNDAVEGIINSVKLLNQ